MRARGRTQGSADGRGRALGGATRPLILAAVAIALLAAGSTLALAGSHGRRGATAVRPPNAAQLSAAIRAERRREARLRSRAARRRRAHSRHAYRRLHAAAARSLAQAAFPAAFDAPQRVGLPLAAGERVRYTSERSALIGVAGRRRAVAESSVPIAARNADGSLSALDDTLAQSGGGFAPRHAAVATRVAADARGGIAFAAAGIRVLPQAPADPQPATVNGRLFYANTATDTDLAVESTPTGAETFTQIRSSASPEDFSYRLDLPPGASVRAVVGANGFPAGAEVVRDGRLLMEIDPPLTSDADGQRVPTSYRLDGNTLTMHVAHREGSYRYPLLADPNFNVVENDNPLLDTLTWGYTQSSGSAYYRSAWAASDNSAGHLQINAPAGSYNAWDFAQWVWGTAPHAFIYRIDYDNFWSNSYQCTFTGIYSPSAGAYQARSQYCGPFSGYYVTDCVESTYCSPGYGDDNNSIVFGMINYTASFFDGGSANWLNGAVMYEQDRHPAYVVSQSAGTPSSWVDNYTITPSATLSDQGLGVSQAVLMLNGNGVLTNTAPCTGSPYNGCSNPPQPCGGDRLNPCPANPPRYSGGATSWTTSFGYSTSQLHSGAYAAAIGAVDIVQQSSNGPGWTVKVDHGDGLALASGSPSGSLWDARGGSISSDASVSATASNPYSGVGSIEVDVDGARKAYAANGNPCDGCSASVSYTLPVNLYSEGAHQVAIVGSDEAGHTKTFAQWQVTVQRTDMGQQHNNYTFDWQDLNGQQDIEVNVANGNAFLRSRDLSFAQNQIDLPFERYFNTEWKGHRGSFGWRSTANVGPDMSLSTVNANEQLTFADGSWITFTKQSDGSWAGSADIDMTLTSNSDGSWDLTDNPTGLVYHFVGSHAQTITDADGASVKLTYNSNGTLASVSDSTTGTSTTFTEDANGDVTKVVQGGQTYLYTYGGPDGKSLVSYKDPSGNLTQYQYDTTAAGKLDRVTLSGGTYWQLAYDSDGRISSIQNVTDPTAGSGPITTFAYNAGSTVVTDPQNQQITYSYGPDLALTSTSANPLPTDYQDCIDSLADGGASAVGDPGSEPSDPTTGALGNQLYCQTLNRDAPVTTVDGPVYDPDPPDGGVVTYDACTAQDTATNCALATPAVDPPQPPSVISGCLQPCNVPIFGIANNMFPTDQTQEYADPHFQRLNVNHVRATVPYDLVNDSSRLATFKRQYDTAWGTYHESMMVSFERSHNHPRRLPSKREYQRDVRKFMSEFPGVKTYSAWNEPNFPAQPTRYPGRRAHRGGGGPSRAAAYTFIVQRACQATEGNCTVVAADFSSRTANGSTSRYEDDYRNALQTKDAQGGLSVPAVWGFHPYTEVKQMDQSFSQTHSFMQHAPAGSRVWFTEVGAKYEPRGGDSAPVAQAKRVDYLLSMLASGNPIDRLYYYYFWDPSPSHEATYATSLMTPGGTVPSTTRPAYYQYQCRTNPSAGACPPDGQSNTTNP